MTETVGREGQRGPAAGGVDAAPPTQPAWFRRLPLLLAVGDAVLLFGAMVVISTVRFGLSWPTYPLSHYVVGFLVATGIHLGVFYFGGLYEPEERLGSRPRLPRVMALTAVAVLLCAGVALLTGRYLMPRGNLLALLIVGALLVAGSRRALRGLRRLWEGRPRLLLVGAPDEVLSAQEHLAATTGRQLELVGHAGSDEDLTARVTETGATDVLLLSGRTLQQVYPEPLSTFERSAVGALQLVRPCDSLLGLRGVRELGGMPVVGLRSHVMANSQRRLKRMLDVVLLVVLAPVAVPLTALVALYVRVLAGRPVLYRQERVGRDGEVFSLVKFRTMHRDAEDVSGPVLATVRDPRVVRGLQWLRDVRLDELPQMWHVLRGQMAIVGPRPERPALVAHYDRLIPGYERRREVPPGITGLAQVHGRYHTDPEYKLGHDVQYLVNWSPLLDLQILLRTVWIVLARRV